MCEGRNTIREYDKIIIGAGMYGLYAANYCAGKGESVLVLEYDSYSMSNVGITVMDGPFFSIMPFGLTGYHSLTSVTFTPHITSYSPLPVFKCQHGVECSPEQLGNCDLCENKPRTAWNFMSKLAKKYLNDDISFEYRNSLFSIKPVLMASEIDDSRPTVIRKASEKYEKLNESKAGNKMTFRDRTELAFDVLAGFSNIGVRITTGILVIFFLIAVLAGIFTVKTCLALDNIASGWITIMSFLSISVLGVFFVLVLIFKYLVIILREVQNKPIYVYKSIERITGKGAK